ncbi:MAG: hypothetical protein KC431_27555, partial [Myxococcales bacterium]|nr:hypothetical protein [Myxococcales bacterium]
RTYGYAVRYWTPAELNSLAAPVTRELVLNRLLWGAVSLGLLALTAVRYRMVLPTGGKAGERADEVEKAPEVLPALPRVQPRNDMRAALAALAVQSRSEIRGLVRGVPFLIIALFGALNILGAAFALIERGGTVTLPVTHIMLDVVEGGMAAFMLIVLVFYAGELVHRERRYKLDELFDALPVPNWVPLLAKLLALLTGMLVLLTLAATVTVIFQLGKGYTTVEIGLYLRSVLLLQLPVWVPLCVAAVVAQVLVNHKFLGYGVMVLIFVAQAALPALDFEHNLYNFGGFPGVTYSDMNGYGHFVGGHAAFVVYWWAVALLLVLIAELFWVRGTDNPLRLRIRAARARLSRGRVAAVFVGTALWLGSGAWIVYNTTVLNSYRPSDDEEELRVRYERDYKQYEGLAQPRITAVEVEADIHPQERRVEV